VLNGGFSIAAQGAIMGATEIIVLAFVVLFMGGMAALVAYSNTPAKENGKEEPKK
jgi:hypothetical protein